MNIVVVNDLEDCKRLWNAFSPKERLYDLWGATIAFFESSHCEPYFLVLKDGKKELGVLPLSLFKENGNYYFFEGDYLENLGFWFDPAFFPLVFEHIPAGTKLHDVNSTAVQKILTEHPQFSSHFTESGFRYYIDLGRYNHNPEEFLKTFSKKHRKNLLYDLRNLEKTKYSVDWEGRQHFDDFVKFNLKRFGTDSDFHDEFFHKNISRFVTFLDEQELLHTVLVKIDGVIQGIELAAFYNGVYYVINGGYNRDVENLGKLLIWLHIKKACSLQARQIDFSVGEANGWKDLWNCQREVYYTFKK